MGTKLYTTVIEAFDELNEFDRRMCIDAMYLQNKSHNLYKHYTFGISLDRALGIISWAEAGEALNYDFYNLYTKVILGNYVFDEKIVMSDGDYDDDI